MSATSTDRLDKGLPGAGQWTETYKQPSDVNLSFGDDGPGAGDLGETCVQCAKLMTASDDNEIQNLCSDCYELVTCAMPGCMVLAHTESSSGYCTEHADEFSDW